MTTKVLTAGGPAVVAIALSACAGASDGAGGDTESKRAQAAVRFAKCMRENGVPDFRDPGANGGFEITPDDPRTPPVNVERAQEKCGHLLAQAGPVSPEDRDQAEEAEPRLLAFARCMRERGIDLPDPDTRGGGVAITLPDGLDPENPDPRYVRAERACRSHIEGLLEEGR